MSVFRVFVPITDMVKNAASATNSIADLIASTSLPIGQKILVSRLTQKHGIGKILL